MAPSQWRDDAAKIFDFFHCGAGLRVGGIDVAR